MGLHFLDFLSQSPEAFIFNKASNKTNFGGFFMILYVIAFLVIFLYYILDYASQENYSIDYSYYFFDHHKIENSNIPKNFTFGYEIINTNNELLSNRFSLLKGWNENDFTIIPRNKAITDNFESVMNFSLVYECYDDNCTIDEDINEGIYSIQFLVLSEIYNLQNDNPVSSTQVLFPLTGNIDEFSHFLYSLTEIQCVDLKFLGKMT